MKLTGKNAVVTGGGTGIGAGIAQALASEGCRVAIGGRREQKLRAVADGWTGAGAIVAQTLDVANRQSVGEFFAWAAEELGDIHVLVNAAGMNIRTRTMATMTPEQWDQVMSVNATGAFNCMRAVLPQMRKRTDGLVINISSVAGKRALTLGGVAYAASKFAMTALGTIVGNEEAKNGIRVTNIYPGEVNTPILDDRPEPVSDERKAAMVQPEDFAELVVAIVNLHPRAHVSEMVLKPTVQEFV
jgi:NADP-dependent 3-hydroxy acid dehydrogenase YdfG